MATATPETTTGTIWAFDPAHTHVGFSARHMMVTTVRGLFTSVNGTIVGDLDHPEDAEVNVEIEAASIDSRQDQRDTHLRSEDFLHVETYPNITFTSTKIERKSDDQFRVYGNLTIRGVTKEVVLNAELNGVGTNPWGMEVIGLTAETTINRKDFGLNWNVALETGGWLVSDNVKITIDLEAVKQS